MGFTIFLINIGLLLIVIVNCIVYIFVFSCKDYNIFFIKKKKKNISIVTNKQCYDWKYNKVFLRDSKGFTAS